MKFSNDTIAILKNFATINPSILFKPGSVLKTIHPQKTVMATANITETIDNKAAVYDLSRFLSTISLFDDPDIEFGDDRFVITGGGGKTTLNYTYAAENMIVTPGEKEITFPAPEAVIDLMWKDLDSVVKAAGVLKLPELAFISDGSTIRLSAVNAKTPTSDSFNVVVAESADNSFAEFNMNLKVENIRLMPADYKVSLSTRGLAQFTSPKVNYFIALEAK